MNPLSIRLAVALAVAALVAQAAPASIPHEPGADPVSTATATAGPPSTPIARMDGDLPTPVALVVAPDRPVPPAARMDGDLPPRAVAAVARTGRPSGVGEGLATLPARQLPPNGTYWSSQARPILVDGTGGFDWEAAGIGFAVAAGLVLVGGGLAVATHRSRQTGSMAH